MHALRRLIRLCEAIDPDEHWMVVRIFGVETAVGWRRDKDAANRSHHRGLSLADGIPVISDTSSKSWLQVVEGQERQVYAGFGTGGGRLIVVTQWTDEGDTPAVRIISVRRFERRDRHQIEMNEDTFDPTIDPDNPPLTGKEVMVPARELFLKKHAEIAAKIAARKKAEQQQKAIKPKSE